MDRAYEILRESYGENAKFREGQKEAIEAVVNEKRTLVVQKTGWGKSLVYFLATKLLKEKKRDGITLIISPLLALMNNQIDSAQRLGLNIKTINSDNKDEWDNIISDICDNNTVDALIISPERLANSDFVKDCLDKIKNRVNLFVVDEAHCISDWGHDFRPDYRRIVKILQLMPSNVPVLATTATANDRVVNDIVAQLGENLVISRGELIRESLAIQVIKLQKKEDRLAWLAENIEKMPGSGVVYCLTKADCDLVTDWLNENNIKSEKYYADISKEYKAITLDKFQKNEIKVLVATVAFGMGYDKPDIGFVIHFQRPANIVSYYQQIGRAGRGIELAYAVLLCGEEDEHINQYFINSAFPTEKDMNIVVDFITDNPGKSISEIKGALNIRANRVEKTLKYLTVSDDIYTEDVNRKKCYYKSAKKWKPDLERSEGITAIRYKEMQDMDEFTKQKGCYMKYIAEKLDDVNAKVCGKCSNCGGLLFDERVGAETVQRAQQFIKSKFGVIEPRKQFPDKTKIESEFQFKGGIVLSNYADAGYGMAVQKGKYLDGYFADELVDASVKILSEFIKNNNIEWITPVTSKRHPKLVPDFAKRLADRLGIGYFEGIKKLDAEEQKKFENSDGQYKNANNSFEIIQVKKENILLVDDMVDSRWTFTVCTIKMREMGSGDIYPFALANTAGRGDN
ncbi:type III restriction enzyme, res subunit / helicase C-terminal domain multi-domain protein [Lachnoanaerobaculum saburreum F0468]|jgi:ATP-dependent DNA helicase, recQ family|uniref:DNA 3'-5' helicase n=1 Tax=Lachnoanaerobaculum saburreum F0468 TaxID=1095750 RepID=I0R4P2_9FIRM|nr:RecQ family ATP-dependent DNA helicase [Lachnoanaerobaculum saburreum]EIC94650.1 type III restriction enzyme, res subunit / helicase C-terminal domain multi-domain protein [Lachnoanaerobaculum saburreum F0468]